MKITNKKDKNFNYMVIYCGIKYTIIYVGCHNRNYFVSGVNAVLS